MFEVGFSEIVLILGLALLVLGPEKLPGLAEKVGRWTGRARSMARQLRTQLEQEVSLEELAKSKPMQAPKTEPDTSSAAPASDGFDYDQPIPDVDTTPEAMHGRSTQQTTGASAAGTPESDPMSSELDTTPEAMHGTAKNKAHSEPS